MNIKLLMLPILALLMVGAVFAANPTTSACTYTATTPADDTRYDGETDSFTIALQFDGAWNVSNATFYLLGGDTGPKSWFVEVADTVNTTFSKTINFKDENIKDARTYHFYGTFEMNNNSIDNGFYNFTSLTGVTCNTRDFMTDFDKSNHFSVLDTDVDNSKDDTLRNSLMIIALVGILVLVVKNKK